MKPRDHLAALEKVAFRPGEQPLIFETGGPTMCLLSDVKYHLSEVAAEFDDMQKQLSAARRDATQLRKGMGLKPPKPGARGVKHLFPEKLTVGEEGRIRRACEAHRADFDRVVEAAALYSEMNAVKYASWPAAIEVALNNDYQWLRLARKAAPPAATVGDHKPTPQQLAARARLEAAKNRQAAEDARAKAKREREKRDRGDES